jgi:hypothetical protein
LKGGLIGELQQYFTVNKITDDKEKIANLLLFGGAGISKTYKPLDAGGQNMTVALQTTSEQTDSCAVVGLFIFLKHFYKNFNFFLALPMSNVILEGRLDIPLNKYWDEFNEEFDKLKIQRNRKEEKEKEIRKKDKENEEKEFDFPFEF